MAGPLLGGPGLRTDRPFWVAQHRQEAPREREGVLRQVQAAVLDAVERVRGVGKGDRRRRDAPRDRHGNLTLRLIKGGHALLGGRRLRKREEVDADAGRHRQAVQS